MVYSMNKNLYDTYIEAFTTRDRNGFITKQGTYNDVLSYVNQTFGLKETVAKIDLR